MELTTNLHLQKPDYPETADVEVINDNMDIIDGSIGIKFTNQVSDITEPNKHPLVFETSTNNLFFWHPNSNRWILVAINDITSTNPYRIVIPLVGTDDVDVDLTSQNNPFQIGRNDKPNMAFDVNEIQCRDGDGAPRSIAINNNGGHVTLGGPNTGLVEGEAGGVYIPSMIPKRDSISSNITDYRSTSWSAGGPVGAAERCEIDIVAHYACRFMVFMTASVQGLSSGVEGVLCLGSSYGGSYIDDPNTAPEERLVRFTGTHKQQVALNYFFDPPTSYRGKKLNIAMYFKAAATMPVGQGFTIFTRRLHVLPVT